MNFKKLANYINFGIIASTSRFISVLSVNDYGQNDVLGNVLTHFISNSKNHLQTRTCNLISNFFFFFCELGAFHQISKQVKNSYLFLIIIILSLILQT